MALVQASVKHQVDLVKLRCENNKLQTALQKAIDEKDDKECAHIQVVSKEENNYAFQKLYNLFNKVVFAPTLYNS